MSLLLPSSVAFLVVWLWLFAPILVDALRSQPMLEDDVIIRATKTVAAAPWEFSMIVLVVVGVLVAP